MGLREAFQAGAKAITTAFGNVPESVTYRKITAVTYNPATSTTPTETVTTVSGLKVFWQDIDTRRIDGKAVLVRDREILVAATLMGTVVPTVNGEFERSNGEQWRIINVLEDPAGATYTCQVRQ